MCRPGSNVNPDISDIFFNTDTGAKHYNAHDPVLLEAATMLLASLGRLGVPDLPTPEELVCDFIGRI